MLSPLFHAIDRPADESTDATVGKVSEASPEAITFIETQSSQILPARPGRDPLSWELVVCPARKVSDCPLKELIGDTGANNDVAGQADVVGIPSRIARLPMLFTTANDVTKAKYTAPMRLKSLGQTIAPHVLKNSPALLSISARVMGIGWHYIWLGLTMRTLNLAFHVATRLPRQ